MDEVSKTFCVYPWINLHTNTDGRCKLCCHVYTEDYIKVKNQDAIIGIDSFDSIWHGDYMTDVRNKMLKGQPVKECKRCYEHEQKGLESSREWANKNFHLESTEIYDPIHLELRLGNHCNLKCNSCWAPSSDNIYKERKKIIATESLPGWLSDQWNHEIKSVERFDWQWFETDEFKMLIDRIAPTLKRLYMTGGEPTLITANQYVIDKLIEHGNKDCHVCWTTNMTTWPEGFYDKLEFFESSEIQMSIDGYGDVNSYLRYPTDWSKVEQNFAKAQALPDKVELKIYFVYQAWNVFDVGNLVEWLEKNQKRRVDFVPIFLEHPDQLHSSVWPKQVKQQILAGLKSIHTGTHKDAIERIINYTHNSDKYSKQILQRMKTFIEINEKYRKLQFSNIFPYLNEILGEECKI